MWVLEGFRCPRLGLAFPEGEFGTSRAQPEGDKRLPRETQNSIEGNKNPAKTHISRMRILLFNFVPTSFGRRSKGKNKLSFQPGLEKLKPCPSAKKLVLEKRKTQKTLPQRWEQS
jgi:hypothetical protein